MRLLLFGATGMIGQGVVRECLVESRVEALTVIGRTACGVENPKLAEVIHDDLLDLGAIEGALTGFDACLFCLGASAAGMTEEQYHRITHDYTLAVAESVLRLNPAITFCYISGAGTDATEKGRSMWARVKGKTENALLAMPFEAAYMFRPGFIQPLDGIKSKTRSYRVMYTILGPIYPLLKPLFPGLVTNTRNLGAAMITVAISGHHEKVLETRAINALAGDRATRAGR